jgi:hypothetical protein
MSARRLPPWDGLTAVDKAYREQANGSSGAFKKLGRDRALILAPVSFHVTAFLAQVEARLPRLGTKLPFKIPILTPAIPTFPSLTSKRPLNPLSDQGKGVGSCQTTLHKLLAVEFDEVDATDLCHNLSFSWLAPPNLDNRDSQYDPPRLGASKLNTGVLTAWR